MLATTTASRPGPAEPELQPDSRRPGGMHMPTRTQRAGLAAATLLLAGCSSLGFPDSGANSGSGQGGNGVAPAPGGPGIVAPGGGGGIDPGQGAAPSPETPAPGQVNLHPVSVWKAEPTIDGRHVTVLLSWWSGVPPCSVFDSVVIARDGSTISLTPREGSAPGSADVACPAIAKETSTVVDLGELDPGTWTLRTSGDLAPITITIR